MSESEAWFDKFLEQPIAEGCKELESPTPLASELIQSIWPIIGRADGEWKAPGTAFVISKGGLMLTARHVIPKTWPQRSSGRLECDGPFLALYMGATNTPSAKPRLFFIDEVTYGVSDDVAVCQLRAADKLGPFDFVPLKLRPVPPEVGEEMLAFGYDGLKVMPDAEAEDQLGIKAEARGHFVSGPVNAVHWPRKTNGLSTFPCFDFSASMHSGMSGGPVIDEKGFVCGVMSHSPSWERSSTAAGLALVLGAGLSLPEGRDGPARQATLYDLMRDGTVLHDGSLDRVCLEQLPGGECRVYILSE